jgi:hypothetical protein
MWISFSLQGYDAILEICHLFVPEDAFDQAPNTRSASESHGKREFYVGGERQDSRQRYRSRLAGKVNCRARNQPDNPKDARSAHSGTEERVSLHNTYPR